MTALLLWAILSNIWRFRSRRRRCNSADNCFSDYQATLKGKVEQISMSCKDDCWDSDPIESFWATLKTECVSGVFDTHTRAWTEIFSYTTGFYNTTRLHSTLDYVSPVNLNTLT